MDRKQQPGMWCIFLVSFSLCTTAKTECSVEWLGLKIKIYTKTPQGICDWCREYTLCPAPGTFSWWLRPAEGQVRMVAKPEQAHLWCLKHVSWCPWCPRGSIGGWRAPCGLARMGAGSTSEEGKKGCWGWASSIGFPGLLHTVYISIWHAQSLHLLNHDFKHRNQQIKCIRFFFCV